MAEQDDAKYQAKKNQLLSQSEPNFSTFQGSQAESDSSSGEDYSLRELLPASRFPAEVDIRFRSIAKSAESAEPGQLVVYRIGQDCPSRLVSDAAARGASGILTEQVLPSPLPQCIVGDVEIAMASVASHMQDRPDRQLLNIAVIGSAGKTTSTLLIASLLRSSGIRTAYWSDLGDSDGIVQSTPDQGIPTGALLIDWLGEAVDNQCKASVIEVSEELSRHGRYDAVEFDMVVVTGSSTKPEDFGPSGIQCVLERLAPAGVVVAPIDDRHAIRAIRETGSRIVTYGVRKAADVTAKIIEQSDGLSTLIVSHRDSTAAMETPLCGGAMAANHAAATVVGLLLDQSLPDIVERLGQLPVVPGRGQRLTSMEQPTVVLETGGSIDRLTQALRTHRSMKSQGKIWCLFAIAPHLTENDLSECGSVMERFADRAIVSATPASKPSFLSRSHEVLDGVKKCAAFRLVADRNRALDWILQEASDQDTIVVFTNEQLQTARQQRSDLKRLRQCVEQNWKARKAAPQAGKNQTPNLSVFG